ncbi:deoxyribodipyrimidine photo-lyase [Thalassolituus oleivorans]|uniref:deoxyribodipyrimidine photo-lyase n=1 Tax=Thalassolituus oleivorans TaxID=187493 RepID=UPI00094949D0|nr:deoxyribodipyrimidine photo-lyase [Thalassolituus oleivorans]APR66234.1 deoxyribodipyrimidine photo-lyase [Thalassolituus oleivorans]
MTRLVWFRTDLRIHDNPALTHACRDQDDDVCAIVFNTLKQWQQHGLGPRKINLMQAAMMELKQQLAQLNIPLAIVTVDNFDDCVSYLQQCMGSQRVSELAFNLEYEVNERKRDIVVGRWCQDHDIIVNKFHDQCLLPPGSVKTQQDEPYRVFTPFKKAWLNIVNNQFAAPLPAPAVRQHNETAFHLLQDHTDITTQADDLWPTDEDSAHNQLNTFLDDDVLRYHEQRDLPDADATSRVSYYLSTGLLSPRQCLYSAWLKNACLLNGGENGIDTWINELIWREFYRHLLVAYPSLCKHKAFKPHTEHVPWRNCEKDFNAWCEGKTGYPIIDAAMQQLRQQGWMHNRLRMITAMFLTKHLLIDWRMGEAFFNEYLVDADLASNNGGWQWSASTGADGAPYFRIFNPTTQSERFDKDGYFLIRYLPELTRLPSKSRHAPSAAERKLCGYPAPIVDHKMARQRALDAFKNTLEVA